MTGEVTKLDTLGTSNEQARRLSTISDSLLDKLNREEMDRRHQFEGQTTAVMNEYERKIYAETVRLTRERDKRLLEIREEYETDRHQQRLTALRAG